MEEIFVKFFLLMCCAGVEGLIGVDVNYLLMPCAGVEGLIAG